VTLAVAFAALALAATPHPIAAPVWSPDGARETVIFTVGLHVSVTPTFPVAVSFM